MVELPKDSSLELPVDLQVQVGERFFLGKGHLVLTYMPLHKSCVVTIKGGDFDNASCVLDAPLFGLLAAFAADPSNIPEPGTVIRSSSGKEDA